MEAFQQSISLPFSYSFTTSTATSSSSSTTPNTMSTSTGLWMDTRIWSKLPQNLVDRVIAFLPPPAFFRGRCVCKRWYALLFSNSFLELYLQVTPHRHWFLFFKHKSLNSYIYNINTNNVIASASSTSTSTSASAGHGIGDQAASSCQGYLFDPDEIAWYPLSFSSVPSGFSPASSSGGLICWVSYEAGPKCLILSNPILGSLTQLPPTLRPRLFPSIGLAVGPSSIDVTVAGDDLISPYAVKNLTAESFHIDGGGFYSIWATSSPLPRLCSFESGRMVQVQGKFYSMNYSPFSVLAYDVAANRWWKIQAPMRRFLRCPSLVESRGRLLLVAAVEKSKLNVPRSLRLWGLQPCGTAWVEMERMPHQLYLQFADADSAAAFRCVGHGEFVFISAPATGKALLFDMGRKMWHWVPPCPYIHGGGQLHGFAYEPRLATPVTRLLDHLTLPFQTFSG